MDERKKRATNQIHRKTRPEALIMEEQQLLFSCNGSFEMRS
jgi:hypothetical protein